MTHAIRVRNIILLVALAASLALVAGEKAWAFWSTSGSGTATSQVATWEGPGNVQASNAGATATISWTAASLQGNTSAVTRYDVVRNDSPNVVCSIIGGLSCNNTGLTSGSYTYKVIAVFATFRQESASSNVIVVDTTAPITSDNSATIGNGWKNTDVTVTLTPTDSNSGIARTYYTTNGSQPTTASAQGTSVVLSAEGTHTIKYFSVDNAGNAEAVKTASTQIRIDKSTPTASITYPNNIAYRNASWTNTFSGTATDSRSGVSSIKLTVQQAQSGNYWSGAAFDSATPVQFTASGTASWTRSFPAVNFPTDGSYVVNVQSVDVATNESPVASATFTIDNATVKPSTPELTAATDSGSSNFDNITNSTTPTFTGTAEANATVAILAGATQVGSSVADSSGNYSVIATIPSNNTYAITAKSTDAAGNISATSDVLSVVIDRIAPNKPGIPDLTSATDSGINSDNVTNSATPTFTGSADANTTVAVLSGTTSFGSSAVSGSTYTVPATIPSEGTYAITVRATDAAGNTSPASDALTTTIDRTAPSVSKMEMLDNNENGKVDRVVTTFSENVAATTLATQWVLDDIPSNGTRSTVSTSAKQATVLITEGSGAADTAVGTFTVQLNANTNGIRDVAGNVASFVATTPTDGANPVLLSATSGGGTTGKMEQGNTMTLKFSEALKASTVVSSTTVTEWRSGGGQGNAWLSIPGIIDGDVSINRSYLVNNNSMIRATATVVLIDSNKTITLTLGTITTSGGGAGTSTSNVTVTPDGRLEDEDGNVAVGTAELSQLF